MVSKVLSCIMKKKKLQIVANTLCVFCVVVSGAGAHLFKSWATYINRSIILTPEVNSFSLLLLFICLSVN